MPRSSSGVYSLPVAAYVAGTTISSTNMNSNLSDIAAALTASIATTGVTALTGALPLYAGTISAPGLTLASDLTTGWYNSAAGAWAYVTGGQVLATFGPANISIPNLIVTNLTVTGTFSAGANRLLGEVVDFGGPSVPALWLLAYGQAISRTTYAALFNVIGSTFGDGDGSTTFNVPDYRGRVGAGRDDMGGVAAGRLTTAGSGIDGLTLGATGGAETETLTVPQLPVHTHTLTDPGHLHTYSKLNATATLANTGGSTEAGVSSTTTSSTSTATTGISLGNTGSGDAHPIVQPTIIMNKIIYTGV